MLMNSNQNEFDSRSELVRAKEILQRSTEIAQRSFRLAESFDVHNKNIQAHRVEAARRSIRSGLHLISMAAQVLSQHGETDSAQKLYAEIRTIQEHLAQIDALVQGASTHKG